MSINGIDMRPGENTFGNRWRFRHISWCVRDCIGPDMDKPRTPWMEAKWFFRYLRFLFFPREMA